MAVDSKPASPSRHAPARRRTTAPALRAPAERQRPAELADRRPRDSRPRPVEPLEQRPSRRARRSFERDRGVDLLLIFVAATLLMVLAVAVLTVVNRWWVLAPVMLVDFAVTFGVLASVIRLLGDDSGPPA